MIEGIDVSNWNSNYGSHIDWVKAATKPIKFAYIKAGSCNASDGTPWTDFSFLYNYEQAHKVLPAIGFYWYFRPDKSPTIQADYFVNLLFGKDYNLPPVCDIELAGQASVVQAFCNQVWNKIGKKVMIYTNPNTWLYNLTGDKTWAKACYLWEAHWGVTSPMALAPWTGWDMWQYNVLQDAQEYGMPLPPEGMTSLDHDRMQDAFFPQPTPPPSPVPPHTHPELEALISSLGQGLTSLYGRVTTLENTKPPIPQNLPYAVFHVGGTVPARYAKDYNANGKPIFIIYPSDTSPTSDRIMLNGTYKVFPTAFVGDGLQKCYAILDPILPGVTLYIRDDDGIIDAK